MFPHWGGDFFGELEFIWNADIKQIRIRLDGDDFTKWEAKENKPDNFSFYFTFEWSLMKYHHSFSTTGMFITIDAANEMLIFISNIIDVHEKILITYYARETSFAKLWKKLYEKYIKNVFMKTIGYNMIIGSMLGKGRLSVSNEQQNR